MYTQPSYGHIRQKEACNVNVHSKKKEKEKKVFERNFAFIQQFWKVKDRLQKRKKLSGPNTFFGSLNVAQLHYPLAT